MEQKWEELSLILDNYKELFPDFKEKHKNDFYWSYEFALNKSIQFESGSKFIFICPLLDCVQFCKNSNIRLEVYNILFN